MGAANYIFANTGQLVRLVVQTLNASGVPTDGYVPLVQNVIFPDLSIASGYPRQMTRIGTGLYAHGVQLPTGADSLGSYVATVYWEEDGYCTGSTSSTVHVPIEITSNGQVDFILPSEPLGGVLVFIDGIKQELSDYVVTGDLLQWLGQDLETDDTMEVLYNFDSSDTVVCTKQKYEVFVITAARPFGISAVSPI